MFMGAKAAASPAPNVNGFEVAVARGLTREAVGRGRREMGRLLTPVSPLGKGMPVARMTPGVVVAGWPALPATTGLDC